MMEESREKSPPAEARPPEALPPEAELRPIRRKEQAFLTRELEYWTRTSLLDTRQAAAISGLYEPAKERFLQVFVGLGAMLIGLGLLSYVAANWMTLGRAVKVALIVGGYLLSVLAAYGFERSYPYTSRAFLLLGGFVYGGGIFLIAQIFNEGGQISDALFWWMAGLVPACLIFRDKMQLLLIQAVALAYFNFLYQGWWWVFDSYYHYGRGYYFFWVSLADPYPLAVLAGLWVLWLRLGDRWSVGFHVNFFVLLNFFGIHVAIYSRDIVTVWVLLYALGLLLLCAASFERLTDALRGWGTALTGLFGFILSFPEVWRLSKTFLRTDFESIALFDMVNIRPEALLAAAAVILACAALLWSVHKGSVSAAAFFCLLVLRYYFDFFYDFMDKALYFTIGGILLMAMGFWLQRARKKRARIRREREAARS